MQNVLMVSFTKHFGSMNLNMNNLGSQVNNLGNQAGTVNETLSKHTTTLHSMQEAIQASKAIRKR